MGPRSEAPHGERGGQLSESNPSEGVRQLLSSSGFGQSRTSEAIPAFDDRLKPWRFRSKSPHQLWISFRNSL